MIGFDNEQQHISTLESTAIQTNHQFACWHQTKTANETKSSRYIIIIIKKQEAVAPLRDTPRFFAVSLPRLVDLVVSFHPPACATPWALL
jgi:hypothetical protein